MTSFPRMRSLGSLPFLFLHDMKPLLIMVSFVLGFLAAQMMPMDIVTYRVPNGNIVKREACEVIYWPADSIEASAPVMESMVIWHDDRAFIYDEELTQNN